MLKASNPPQALVEPQLIKEPSPIQAQTASHILPHQPVVFTLTIMYNLPHQKHMLQIPHHITTAMPITEVETDNLSTNLLKLCVWTMKIVLTMLNKRVLNVSMDV